MSHEPTKATRDTVLMHAMVGTPQSDIARVLDIDDKTLRKYYRDELDLATAKANATIGGALYNKAKGGDTAAMIFWLKTRAGWKEKNEIDLGIQKDNPINALITKVLGNTLDPQ